MTVQTQGGLVPAEWLAQAHTENARLEQDNLNLIQRAEAAERDRDQAHEHLVKAEAKSARYAAGLRALAVSIEQLTAQLYSGDMIAGRR